MSIAVLTQVYDEMRRLAIAGSVVAPGDFRLKKLLPSLEKAAQKAAVFSKVAEAVKGLVESNEKTSAAALLQLTTLVNAILYTQGETGLQGKLELVESIDLGQQRTQVSARVLKPVMEALTTTGSGRLEIIRDAHERGAMRDLRLIEPSLAALDDVYAEIADFVARQILPMYGKAILSELKAGFDPKGRGGHVRRLLLMHQIDPAGTREIVERALEDGSKEVRIAAIRCLGDSPDDVPFLLQQVKSRTKDVRTAALNALGSSDADDAVKVLCDAISGTDLALAIEPIRDSRNRTLTSYLHEAAGKQFDELLSSKEKDTKKLGKRIDRMLLMLECLRGRNDKRTEKLLLTMFAERERIDAIKGEPGGKDLVERLITIMVAASSKAQAALVDSHATLAAESLPSALLAACRSRKPAEVFDLFSPYLAAKVDEKKKKRDPAYAKREAIIELFLESHRWWYYDDEDAPEHLDLVSTLDPRWLDVAVSLKRSELVQTLAFPGHAKSNDMLAELFQQKLNERKDDWELGSLLRTMIRVAHPEAVDSTIEVIRKHAKSKHGHGLYWIGHVIPRLPKSEAVPKLEALLPSLPDRMADQLLDHLTELKDAD